MRGRSLFAGVVVVLSVLLAGSGASALAGRAGHEQGKRGASGLGLAQVRAISADRPARVIVVLRRQFLDLPADRAHIRSRVAAVQPAEQSVGAVIRSDGGRVLNGYRTISAVSAVVTAADRRALSRDGAVAEVIPDVLVSEPRQPEVVAGPGSGQAGTAGGGQAICPSDPSHPLVEPEGLSLIKADQVSGVDGSGVRVGFVADSIDVNNPDFIRPDGSHVIFDYRDFTGEGTQTPTYDFEAFGDASSIAAQGTTVHDLSNFVSPAHPLPTGCNVIFRGVAPGASLAAMKAFGNADTPLSTILEAFDWAVSVDHVDVLNESVGLDAVPDTGQNLLVQFNRQAVAAGVTVVASSGDEGPGNTIISPASDPSAIAVGASTQLRTLAETGFAGGDLFDKGWLNDNVSYFSSSGFTENGRTIDLVAPGDTGLETCTPDPLYLNCQNLGPGLSDVAYFSGTSESAPIVAGVAALVIEAYRNTHGGASPTPGLVRQILLSTADDLGYPSSEQGAGLVDAAAAVHEAEVVDRWPGATPAGNQPAPAGSASAPSFLASPGQLDLVATAGHESAGQVTVRNTSTVPERISASVRSLPSPFADQAGQATLDTATDPTFLDDLGTPQSYREVTFTVPPGVALLGASEAHDGGGLPVNMTLFDPLDRLANYSFGSGPTDYNHAEVSDPAPGRWTAVFYTPQSGGYSGSLLYDFTFSRFVSVDAVRPGSLVIPPNGQGVFSVDPPPSAPPGDRDEELVLANGLGQQSIVPVVIRTLVPLVRGRGTFNGTVTGGDGYSGIGSREAFQFDVPPGAPAVGVNVTVPDAPGTELTGYLVGPDGETSAEAATADDGSGNQVMQLHHLAPLPGRWTFEEYAADPVGGTSITPTFTGQVTLAGVPVTAAGVPNGPQARIPAGASQTASVTVTNPGPSPISVFLDARRNTTTQYSLVAVNHASVTLPRTRSAPHFLVPTQTTTLQAAVQATAPIEFDWGFYDPSLLGTGSGDSASSTFSAAEVAPVEWEIDPALVGPLAGPTSATATAGMIATTRTFDPSVSTSTGDPELSTIERPAPAATPVTIPPGGSAKLTATFTPTASDGGHVAGDLYVVDDVVAGPAFNELGEIPYSFRVG